MTDTPRIRLATHTDALGIATVHVDSWKTAYQNVVPQDFLDQLTVKSRAQNWARNMQNPLNQMFVYVAESPTGEIIGFASAGPPQTPEPKDYDGELYAIYLLPQYFRQGIGTRLTQQVIDHLRDLQKNSLIIWVLAENPNSRAFYKKLGGKLVGEKAYEIGGKELQAVAYGWDSLDEVQTTQ